ncbi:gamma-tubulin complex component 5 [Macrosteles quadrilineatus]|uniref:gamma-tubulin complex component 5 n=1 Tax=Macrosteles quadrilineatus TaxID=74068 RepID=UPI0023E129AC|nr:gamma-tubulin complex component 5 [Macrosteles quadrilineatus]
MAISIFNRKKQFFAPEVEGLIKQLTNFKEDDRNYQEVEKFIYSNIIHHNFATVDIAIVKNTIDGYVEKFHAHGLSKRAKQLKELVDKYVTSDSSQHTQLNVQWHVLWLLLNLSTRPTAVSDECVSIEELPEFIKEEEEIDWAEYLREGFEEFRYPSDESDDDLDWLSVSEEDCTGVEYVSDANEEDLKSFGNIPHPSLWQLTPQLSQRETLRRVVREGKEAEEWLSSNLQHSWWSDKSFRSVLESHHPETRVCQIWEETFKSQVGEDSTDQLLVISEFKVLHEVLWMLQVPTDCALFYQDDNDKFHVKADVSMPSTIPETLGLYLEEFCPYINMVSCLKTFEELLNEQEMGDSPPPVTYKAYCAALCRQLQKFTEVVIGIETRLNKQDETMTLISVREELSPALKILQYLHCIHIKAITDWVSQPAWFCATRLLSVLYEIVSEASDEKLLEVSLDIFIHSFHPYLDIIDVWLCEGRLEDWRKEFLVIKEDGGIPEVMPYESEMLKCGVTPVRLLTSLVDVVREAGRTMEIVNSLNKLSQFRDTVRNKGCLFREFSDNVYSEIKRLKDKISELPKIDEEIPDNVTEKICYTSVRSSCGDLIEDEEKSIHEESESKAISPVSSRKSSRPTSPTALVPRYLQSLSGKAMYAQTMSVLLQNPLLGEVFRGYLSPPRPPSPPAVKPVFPQEASDSDCSVSLVGLMSIHSVLERQLSLVESRHKSASSLVTDTLLTEHNLCKHLTVLRTVYFMENGNLAQSFYSYLFKEIEAGTWNNSISLNAQLKVCVEEYFPGFENYFTVQIETSCRDKSSNALVHHIIPAISLAYRVDWPVSLVISEASIASYNKVFRFLLHLKYAFWTLHNTRFSDLTDSSHPLWVRRLHVLKTWMLHSTNTLHSYFMGLVLRSYSTHLEESVLSADSLQVIVQAHNKFLDEVKIHCLQDKTNYLENFIKRLLKLCSMLAELWELEVVGGGDLEAELCVLEEAFLVAYHSLIHCLEMVSPEEDQGNFLYELKCEIASSEPECFTLEAKSINS